MDVCTFLDYMKSYLELNFFKFNFDGIQDEMTPDFNNDDGVVEVEEEVAEGNALCLSSIINFEANRRGYERIRKSIGEEFGSDGIKAVKTVYQIRKERTDIIGGTIEPSSQIYDHIVYEKKAEVTLEERMAENAIKLEKGEKVIMGLTDVKYAQLKGNFGEYITHLRNKLCKLRYCYCKG